MQAMEILENLFFIERGYLNGNHFVCRSDPPVLIDSAYGGDFAETRRRISDLGVDLSDVRTIVNTHCHCDHIGGNRAIQEQSGCDIALHRIGKHFIDTRNDWATWWRYYHQEADFFDCTTALDDGDVISVGPHPFQVIHTPGHSADGVVLYHPGEKLLISSDTLWEADMAVMTERVEGSTAALDMMASLEAIEALDVRRVYPGHGRPFTDFNGAVERAKARVRRYLDDRSAMGGDLLKKITVYTLLMRSSVAEDRFFDRLMDTWWFRETVDLYFDGRYREKYDHVMAQLTGRGIVRRDGGRLSTGVKP